MSEPSSWGRADELRMLAHRLLQIADEQDRPADTARGERKRPSDDPEYSRQFLRSLAHGVYRRRRRRAEYFERELFGEVGWDILLDLFIHAMEGKLVPTTSLCIAAETPVPTGLRWISLLEGKGLVERSTSESDGRVTYVSLTEEGQQAMRRFLVAECGAGTVPLP